MKTSKKRRRAHRHEEASAPAPIGAREPLPARAIDYSEPADPSDREQADVERFAVATRVGPDEPAVDRDLEH